MNLPRRAALLVRSANVSIIAEIALPVVRRGWQEGLGDCPGHRFGKPVRLPVTRSLVERNDLLGKATCRCAEIEPAGGYDLVSEKFFRGKRVEQRLQRLAAID